MFSLTICFGPAATTWAFLFKEQKPAKEAINALRECIKLKAGIEVKDDFGQEAFVELPIHGLCLEDLDAVEAGRIQRSLAEERAKVKLMQAAKTDPVISAAMRQQTPVLTPMGGGFRA